MADERNTYIKRINIGYIGIYPLSSDRMEVHILRGRKREAHKWKIESERDKASWIRVGDIVGAS